MIISVVFYSFILFLSLTIYFIAKTIYSELIHSWLLNKLEPVKCKLFGHQLATCYDATQKIRYEFCERCGKDFK